MRLPDDPAKFSNRWRYVEVARYVPKLEKVIRDPYIVEWEAVEDYRKKNRNVGVYTSVWNYNDRDLDKATRLGPLYFDLDSDDVRRVHHEAIELVNCLRYLIPESAIRVYFTGKKGFHVECEPIALGISPSNELPGLFRYIAAELTEQIGLTTIDFSVYDARRMWRLPNSQHQATGLFKVDLGVDQLLNGTIESIQNYAKEPHWEVLPEQIFDARANEWFREWDYKRIEKQAFTTQDHINRFSKMGTSSLRKMDNDLAFNPLLLFERCHAMNDLWKKAERTKDLSHEERLFLCSILSYNEEAQEYLHAILSNCSDYDPPRTQSHIDDWVRRRDLGIGGRPYSCKTANAKGVGCGDCELKPKERITKIGDHWISTGELAEPSPLRYGYYRKRDDVF